MEAERKNIFICGLGWDGRIGERTVCWLRWANGAKGGNTSFVTGWEIEGSWGLGGGRSKVGICSYVRRKIMRCMWFGKHGKAKRDGRIPK